MKRLTCEMCGSTDLIKQDGVFVCQSCGCKYSVEEARKIMIEGTVEVTGTVRVDDAEAKKEQIHNYLQMAQAAYDGKDYDGAISYCDRILEIDANNFEAWKLKTKATIDGATVQNYKDKIPLAIIAAKRAVEQAPDTQKYDLASELFISIKTRIIDLIHVLNSYAYRKSNPSYSVETRKIMLQWLSALTDIPFLSKSLMEAEVKDFEMRENTTWLSAHYEPWFSEVSLSDKDERYNVTFRRALSEKIKLEESREEEFKAKAKAEADAKRAAYWDAHADEKMALEQHKIEAEARIAALEAEMEALPELARKKDLDERITALKNEREQLGLFKMKEKKAIQAQIDEMQINLSTIEKSLAEKASPIQEKIDAEKAIISETNAELTMER